MATQYQNGGWYEGRQYWNGQFGAPGQIINPNQQGAGQQVSSEVNRQSSVAQGKAPDAIQNYLAQQNQQAQPNGGGGMGGYGGDTGGGGIFDAAQSILNFQNQANKPVSDALQNVQKSTEQKYKDLVAEIKGNKQQAVDKQTVATNTELGNRGIGPDSGLYQTTLNNSLQPVNQQYESQVNQATDAGALASSDLAVRIAQAQSGDPLQALQLAQSLQSKANNPYISIGDNSSVFNTQTGQFTQNPNSTASSTTGW